MVSRRDAKLGRWAFWLHAIILAAAIAACVML